MSQEVDYNKMLVPKLKEELAKRSLPQTGNKAELVARLQQSDVDLKNESGAEGGSQDGEEQMEGDGANEEERELEGEGDGQEEGGEGAEGDANGDAEEEEQGEGEGEEATEGDEASKAKTGEKKEPTEAEKKKAERDELHKKIEALYSIDYPQLDRDSFVLKLQGKKTKVTCVNDTLKDLATVTPDRTLVVHPVTLDEMRSANFQEIVDKCHKFSFDFFDKSNVKTTSGYAKFVFNSIDEVNRYQEELKAMNEAFKFDKLKFESRENEDDIILSGFKAPSVPNDYRPIVQRLLYVGNLPNDVTENTLRDLFPDALRCIVAPSPTPPRKGSEENAEKSEPSRYAFIEYESEEQLTKAAEDYKDLSLNDDKLFVIKAIAVRKDKSGVISDYIRAMIIDKVRRLKKIVKTPINKNESDLKSINEKITECMDQLTKDAELRESWGMELGKLETSMVEEELSDSQGQRGGRGGFRGRGRGSRGSSGSYGRGSGMSYGMSMRGGGGYGSSGYGGSPGSFRRGGGGGGYYSQPYAGGYNQFMGGMGGMGYQSFGGGGGWSSSQSYAGKRRADDSDRGGSWKRARGGRGRGYY